MTRVLVEVRNVAKRYALSTLAVDDVSLNIYEGECFTLLGPSGSGKTTTLMLIAGFEDLTSGHILVRGVSVGALPPEKREAAFRQELVRYLALPCYRAMFERSGYAADVEQFDRTGAVSEHLTRALGCVGQRRRPRGLGEELSEGGCHAARDPADRLAPCILVSGHGGGRSRVMSRGIEYLRSLTSQYRFVVGAVTVFVVIVLPEGPGGVLDRLLGRAAREARS